jgi:hypothetical protein
VTSLPARTIAAWPIGSVDARRRPSPLLRVQPLVLDEDHRVGIGDRGAQQA